MSFDDLYQHAHSKGFGKGGKESRKSGRIVIIKWLCKKAGIEPYVAPAISHSGNIDPIITEPVILPSGAHAHPEAFLRTSNPDLQRQINVAEAKYQKWPAAQLLPLAMQRSYQLLKDSQGKLPSRSISAMARWLAAWDVLKSPREKQWWLGDGIDLVNKAKAMGYEGPSKKYDVIVWLRAHSTEDAGVPEVAEPTPNLAPAKRKLNGDGSQTVSKRRAKGSTRTG